MKQPDFITLIENGLPHYGVVENEVIDKHIAALLLENRGEPPMHSTVHTHSVQLREPYDIDGKTWTPVVVTNGTSIVAAYTYLGGKEAADGARVVIGVLASLAWPNQ